MKHYQSTIMRLIVIITALRETGSVETPATTSQTSPRKRCFKNFRTKNSEKKCEKCYRSIPVDLNGGCGDLLPDSDQCRIYQRSYEDKSKIECSACKRGFTLTSEHTCRPAKPEIRNCYVQSVSPDPSTPNEICSDCVQGFLVYKATACFLFRNYQFEIPAAKNCLVGGRLGVGNPKAGPVCFMCRPGYSLPTFGYFCEERGLEGCHRHETSYGYQKRADCGSEGTGGCEQVMSEIYSCVECRAEDGWSMQADGKCVLIKEELSE